jgi:hypothetical protein
LPSLSGSDRVDMLRITFLSVVADSFLNAFECQLGGVLLFQYPKRMVDKDIANLVHVERKNAFPLQSGEGVENRRNRSLASLFPASHKRS